MIRLTLAQMRTSLGRLGAAAVAIVTATAFVAATLLAGALVESTTHRAVTASLAGADVVVHATDDAGLGPAEIAELAALDGAAAATGSAVLHAQLSGPDGSAGVQVSPMAGPPELRPWALTAGTAPGPGEIALDEPTADRLGAAVGDEVRLDRPATGADGETVDRTQRLVVSGIVEDPPAIVAPGALALVGERAMAAWLTEDGLGYDRALLTAAARTDGSAGDAAALAGAAAAALPGTFARTAQEEALAQTADLTGDTQTLTWLALGFAAVALLVAALVIANTFQVLVAQRTATLALLRCVGATRAQVRRSVLLEAGVLGVAASLAGVAGGHALGQAAVLVLGSADLGIPVPATVPVTAVSVAVPLATGLVVTVLAALSPARAATRVAPLAALRPAVAPGRGAGRVRLALAALLVLGGATLLLVPAGYMLVTGEESAGLVGPALTAAVAGGALSFVGVMVGAVFVLPRLVRTAGSLAVAAAGRARPAVRLAAVNAARNPRRTSATASALVVAVTLVTMMSTGAASARQSLDAALDAQFPVDVAVVAVGPGPVLGAGQEVAVAGVDGVAAVAAVAALPVQVGDVTVEATVLDPADAAVLRDGSHLEGLAGATVVIGADLAAEAGVADGAPVDLTGPDGTTVTRSAVVRDGGGWLMLLSTTTAEELGTPALAQVWARIAADADTGAVLADVEEAVAGAAGDDAVPFVTGAAAEREAYAQIVDTLLAVVLGLLGAAVLIAVVGVTNTLSLSVLERRHEHALLRAVGLTRGQLRTALVTEGVLLAVVGTGTGVLLGLVYGWAGSVVVLAGTGYVDLVVPWVHVAVVGGGAVAAGVLASVLPARSAVRTPPVAALAA